MRKAEFDHVDEEGNLILSLDGSQVVLETSERLEDALLSSRKIKAQAAAQKRLAPLPISKIQSMIRAGREPEEIAEELQVGEGLIAKVAGHVESEKRAAIQQFLSGFCQKAPVGKERISDVIFRSLSRLGVKKNAVRWSATREGRGPWTVKAEFDREGNRWIPAWSWDGQDNSISSLNEEARYLLEEDMGPLPNPERPKKPNLPPLPSQKKAPAEEKKAPVPPAAPTPKSKDEEEAEEVETELVDLEPKPKPRIAFQPKGKMQRKGVPSWDDILFGGGVTSTQQSEES